MEIRIITIEFKLLLEIFLLVKIIRHTRIKLIDIRF